MRLIARFFSLFFKSMDSWKIFLTYAGLMTLLCAVFGRWSYSCTGSLGGFWCYKFSDDALAQTLFYVVYYLLAGYLLLSFLFDFYNTTFKNTVFKVADIKRISREKVRSIAMFITIFFTMSLPFVAVWFILRKPANPDWRVEFVWFTLAFIFAMLPILQIRLSSAVAFFLENYKIPCGKLLLQKTFTRAYVPIAVFIMLLMIVSIFNLQIYADLNHYAAEYNNFWAAILIEYAAALMRLILCSLFIIFVRAQYELLIDEPELKANVANTDVKTVKKTPKRRPTAKTKHRPTAKTETKKRPKRTLK